MTNQFLTQGIDNKETSRKLIHILNGFWALLLPFIPRILALLFVIIALIFVFILSRPNSKFGSIFHSSFSLMARKEDWDRGYLHGPTIYVFMVFLTIIFIDYRIAGAVFAILAFGDGFATIIGKKYGKNVIYDNKTLEGTFSFFISAFPLSFLVYQLINEFNTPDGGFPFLLTVILPNNINLISIQIVVMIFFSVSLIVSLVELFLGKFINDNFLIPLSAIILFYAFFNLSLSLI